MPGTDRKGRFVHTVGEGYRDRHPGGQVGRDLREVYASGWLDDAVVWRNWFGTYDRQAVSGADGGQRECGEPCGRRLDLPGGAAAAAGWRSGLFGESGRP